MIFSKNSEKFTNEIVSQSSHQTKATHDAVEINENIIVHQANTDQSLTREKSEHVNIHTFKIMANLNLRYL